jgi:acetyltransferase-like isoleucine patch superfamily enzyme
MFKPLRRYGFYGSIRLLIDFFNTKLFFGNSRIVRRPYYIRGKQLIKFNQGFTTGVGMRLDAFDNEIDNTGKIKIEFGKNVQLNDYVHIAAIHSIKIGNNVLIASKVFISDHNHGNYSDITQPHSNPLIAPINRILSKNPVIIEDNVWIGEFVTVLPGVTIKEGSIIGSMSVVTKTIPPYSIAVGVPAHVIKTFNFQTGIWEKVP